ncbi:MAG: radical SAM protein [Candidatus Aenigmarchaeota archaeon]
MERISVSGGENRKKFAIERTTSEITFLYSKKRGGVENEKTKTKNRNSPDSGIEGRRSSSFPTLNEVELELTTACNLRCIHCYADGGNPKKNELNTVEILSFVEHLSEIGVNKLVLTGGEPLLKKDILKIAEFSSDCGLNISVNTNGFLLNEKIASFLSSLNVREIQISLDGARPETHDLIRGREGSFKGAMNAIETCLEKGLPVRIATVLVRQNMNEIEEIAMLCNDLGIKNFSVDLFIPAGRAEGNRISVSLDKYVKLMERLRGIGNISSNPGIHPICGVGFNKISVLSNGDIVPCVAMRSLVAGNIRKDGLVKTFSSSPIFKEMGRANINEIKECKSCKVRNICRGGCRARAFAISGRIVSPDPVHCRLYKQTLTGRRERLGR